MVDFVEYANVLIKMFDEVINESERYMTVFVMQEDHRATLDFIQVKPAPAASSSIESMAEAIPTYPQNLGYKHVDLLTCALVRAADEAIHQQISYRYCEVNPTCQAVLHAHHVVITHIHA